MENENIIIIDQLSFSYQREDTGTGEEQVQRQEGAHRHEPCPGDWPSHYTGGIHHPYSRHPGRRKEKSS